MWDRTTVLSQPPEPLIEILNLAVTHQSRMIELGFATSLIDLCYICSRLLQFSVDGTLLRG